MSSMPTPPVIVHIVGPQGSGKSVVAEAIAAGYSARGLTCAIVNAEEALQRTTADIRHQFAARDFVLIEAEELGQRHQELRPGDMVLRLTRVH